MKQGSRMNVHNTAAIIAQSQDLVDLLPIDGKVEVLNHLIGRLGGKDLQGLSDESRQLLLQVLPATVSAALEATLRIAPHKLCRFDARHTPLYSDVSFVIPRGLSGRKILDAINEVSMARTECRVVDPESLLLQDNRLNTVTADDRFVKLAVWFELHSRSRSEQRAVFARHELEFAPRWALTLAAALYRDANGFPSNRSAIGTSCDAGDLFRGYLVRTASGAVGTNHDGLRGGAYYQEGRHSDVIAAAAFRS